MTVDDILFEQFAAALNHELAGVGASVRIDPLPCGPGAMLLRTSRGQALGWFPDTLDAHALLALESVLLAHATDCVTR